MSNFLRASVLLLFIVSAPLTPARAEERPPNVVIIFLDDSGWADFQPFGDTAYLTPNVQQLANEGARFNRFYVPQAICSASRSALLTGCYPGRTKMFGAHGPYARGLDPKFDTLGTVLKRRGYATAVFGKWHLGDLPETRPLFRGFDENIGLMYSNDMWERHPENPTHWSRFPLQFWRNGQVTIDRVSPEDQTHLTTWYTEAAVDFIERKKDGPFFLYLPHSMPHVPLYVSRKFEGKSGAGLYGDVMMEIDWSVGQVMKALKDNGVEDNTLVIFTSDNGPWLTYGNHAGSTPFREGKGTMFDGGVRSACLIKLPGRIKPGSVSETMLCSIDLLPTIAHLAGADLPSHPIDGKNMWAHILGTATTPTPQAYYPLSNGRIFKGVISGEGRWKLHIPHKYRSLGTLKNDGIPGKYRQREIELSLFDMLNDPYETTNVIKQNPDIAMQLKSYADAHRKRFYPNQKE